MGGSQLDKAQFMMETEGSGGAKVAVLAPSIASVMIIHHQKEKRTQTKKGDSVVDCCSTGNNLQLFILIGRLKGP
jgi:hypothetical protein